LLQLQRHRLRVAGHLRQAVTAGWPGPSTITRFGFRMDSAKYSGGWCEPMPVNTGPGLRGDPASPGKSSPFTSWQEKHSMATTTLRPSMASPRGRPVRARWVHGTVGGRTGSPPARGSARILRGGQSRWSKPVASDRGGPMTHRWRRAARRWGIVEQRDQAQPAPAPRTGEHVQVEGAAHQLGPGPSQ
jgi:hypothetical protein